MSEQKRSFIYNAHTLNDCNKGKKTDDDCLVNTTWVLTKNDLCKQYLPDILNFCTKNNLIVRQEDESHLAVTGSVKNYSDALHVFLYDYKDDICTYHASPDPISIPSEWAEIIDNIIGLDTRTILKPHYQISDNTLVQPRLTLYYTPLQLAGMYNFPSNANGSGQKVGIIELGGGYVASDILTYLSTLGITKIPTIIDVSVDGAVNNPLDASGANLEVILDIEIIAALVPYATIFVYFAPNTLQGFYDAINRAINDRCNIISISWGAPEINWGNTNLNTFNSLFQRGVNSGTTILAASGDGGSSDGVVGNNVDFPASSPYVLGCGGTSVQSSNGSILQESVWPRSGGGVSKSFSTPSYQSNVGFQLNGLRGVPDISGDADPQSGYLVYSLGYGGNIIIGGTSAVSPLWAGLIARINQSIGTSVGYLHPTLYGSTTCRDVINGSNGGYNGGIGWDPCTGNGSPNGNALLSALKGTTLPVAKFTASPLSGNSPLAVTFTDQSDGFPVSYLWNFGDSTLSSQKNPIHTYSTKGTYTITLSVSNSKGSNVLTKNNYITVTTKVIAPVANFMASSMRGRKPFVVSFNDISTNGPTKWAWSFGDTVNNTSTLQYPKHTYSRAGMYTITLVASNSAGMSSMIKRNYITVTL